MNTSHLLRPLLAATFIAALGACAHTPPGTSVELALAKKPDVVRYPAPPAPPVETSITDGGLIAAMPAVEPELPSSKMELVAEAYSRGQFCMQAGKNEEAIAAFQEAVKHDPTFIDAWTNLAALYEKMGNDEKAMEAFRKSKKVAGR